MFLEFAQSPIVGMVLAWLLFGYGMTKRLWVAVCSYPLGITGWSLLASGRFLGGELALVLGLSLPAILPTALVLWVLAGAAREHEKEKHLRVASVIAGVSILLLWTIMRWW